MLSFRVTPFAIWTLSLFACGGATPRTTDPDDWGMTADLRVDAPRGCPGKDVLAQAVSERVGRVAFVARPDAEVLVDVSIQPALGGFGVQVTTRDPEGAVLGSRTLQEQASDCEAIRDAVAFVVALVVSAPPVREAVETAREQTVVELGVRGGGRVGRTPHWSGVVGLYATVVPPRFVPVRFDLTASVPGREDIDGGRELEAWGAS